VNQKQFEIKTLLNVSAATAAATGSAVDLVPSASIAKREMKLIVGASGNTYATATLTSFPIIVEECDTTNGTFTTMEGDTPSNIGTAAGVSEYHVRPQKRYARARIGTVGTGGTSANVFVLLQNMKRSA
jgi:hypothetical protein